MLIFRYFEDLLKSHSEVIGRKISKQPCALNILLFPYKDIKTKLVFAVPTMIIGELVFTDRSHTLKVTSTQLKCFFLN